MDRPATYADLVAAAERLVDPDTRTLEVLGLDAWRWVVVDTFGANQVARMEPFEAVDLELGLLWADAPAQQP